VDDHFDLARETLDLDARNTSTRRFILYQLAQSNILVQLIYILFSFCKPTTFPCLVDLSAENRLDELYDP
jgi:hypothetical protein